MQETLEYIQWLAMQMHPQIRDLSLAMTKHMITLWIATALILWNQFKIKKMLKKLLDEKDKSTPTE